MVCLACNLFARQMLEMLNTKEELMDGAVLYLKIFSLGMPAMAIYNCGNGVMSAAGDTKRPLLYLTIAGALNVALNLLFVIGLHMAADGVALASAIAQCVSAALIVAHLLRRKDSCRLDLRKLRIHKMASKRILMMGVPSGLQNAIFAIANLFVQVGVNSFDAIMVSGNAAAANADTLVFNMMAAYYTACASFASRNWGAGTRTASSRASMSVCSTLSSPARCSAALCCCSVGSSWGCSPTRRRSSTRAWIVCGSWAFPTAYPR